MRFSGVGAALILIQGEDIVMAVGADTKAALAELGAAIQAEADQAGAEDAAVAAAIRAKVDEVKGIVKDEVAAPAPEPEPTPAPPVDGGPVAV